MKILAVDDELVSRKKMVKILSAFGQCDSVKSGSAAISVVKASMEEGNPYRLITLDISMPDVSGTRVLDEIRKMEEAKGIPYEEKISILMVTSKSDVETVRACAGKCNGYVVKPFDRDIMVGKMKKIGLL